MHYCSNVFNMFVFCLLQLLCYVFGVWDILSNKSPEAPVGEGVPWGAEQTEAKEVTNEWYTLTRTIQEILWLQEGYQMQGLIK